MFAKQMKTVSGKHIRKPAGNHYQEKERYSQGSFLIFIFVIKQLVLYY